MSTRILPRSRRRAAVLTLAALATAATAACSGGSSGNTADTSPTDAVSSTTSEPAAPATDSASASSSPASSSATRSPAAAGRVVAITVAGGKVSPPTGRVKVAKGSTVTLQVTSDVADEIHLHGYDKSVDVEKGGTAKLTFRATLTGVFEVELENRALQLTQLQVQ
jgi:hypothetical protein